MPDTVSSSFTDEGTEAQNYSWLEAALESETRQSDSKTSALYHCTT